ncbi:alpha-ketoglutarate-dependent dioxygenase AlkB [Aureibacter tunicatorum]|uniref:Alkylated DNA repair dioxygenase AlkB n=1 Tax=Aureibacter tunicatorum TaxID=866807 RepID=A0AAE3XLS1_9BACT|nr:alpha-ketoglutarate-dependent dioxygenase AlkB [Aureibacter tunicatorum]MDR6238777.1 alkylated DNA repair dioxygenase AlkB [Aureibacter tunicatorum]BDD05292.1 alkylated DNA repair protein [Aureibacter tunicatorum]
MEGIIYIENFVDESEELFEYLRVNLNWDERMSSRKTASFGLAYNYSQISYPYQDFPDRFKNIIISIHAELGFEPNNCLVNYYLDGKSKMGFHSDQTDILDEGTGVAIVSLGATRVLRFRRIDDKETIKDFELPSGTLIFMSNEIQKNWQHAIPKSETENGRMSLTFRKLRVDE